MLGTLLSSKRAMGLRRLPMALCLTTLWRQAIADPSPLLGDGSAPGGFMSHWKAHAMPRRYCVRHDANQRPPAPHVRRFCVGPVYPPSTLLFSGCVPFEGMLLLHVDAHLSRHHFLPGQPEYAVRPHECDTYGREVNGLHGDPDR